MRVVLNSLAGLACLGLAGSFAGAACGQENGVAPSCAPYEAVVKNLAGSYHERPIARAIGGTGQALMVVFASEHGATWTAVSVRPRDRLACIVAAGTNWQMIELPEIGL